MMKSRVMYMRKFQCPNCQTIQYAPKRRATKKDHEKKLWCYVCKKRVNFVQIGTELLRS